MSTQIVCPCTRLVKVVDSQIEYHQTPSGEPCFVSGMRYVSKRLSGVPGQPKVDLVASRGYFCDDCKDFHVDAVVKITVPDPQRN